MSSHFTAVICHQIPAVQPRAQCVACAAGSVFWDEGSGPFKTRRMVSCLVTLSEHGKWCLFSGGPSTEQLQCSENGTRDIIDMFCYKWLGMTFLRNLGEFSGHIHQVWLRGTYRDLEQQPPAVKHFSYVPCMYSYFKNYKHVQSQVKTWKASKDDSFPLPFP